MAPLRLARFFMWSLLLLVSMLSIRVANAQCGTRFISKAANASDVANSCRVSTTPCATINHGVSQACAGDTVTVGEGTWIEDVLLDRRVFLDSSGVNANTLLRNSGAFDTIRVFANGTTINGFTFDGPATRACIRIGDAAHPAVRGTTINNSTVRGCRVGVIVDSVGTTGETIRINGNTISQAVADGSADGGTGVLLIGGVGRVDVRQNTMSNNQGAAIKLLAGPNGLLQIGGNTITNSGLATSAVSRAGVELHGGADVRMEGNLLTGHTGLSGFDDGRAIEIDQITTGKFHCNELRDNDGGISLSGTTNAVSLLQNRINAHAGPGIEIDPGAAAGVTIGETLIYGNGQGLVNLDAVSVNAQHNWWGSADGPLGAGGSGNSVSGPVNTSNLIARTVQPVLARAPSLSGWTRVTAACYDTLQPAIDATPTGGLLLIGAGEIRGRATITRPMDLEGVPGLVPLSFCDRCHASVIDGIQYSGPRTPALKITNVSGLSLKYLTLRGAGLGTGVACYGGHQDSEIGLDLQHVKNSVFRSLSLRENGTTEVRIFGDSDDNLFEDLYADGMIRDGDNDDRCGHRSREAFLIDGGPRVCEGGVGATADRNRITLSNTFHNTRGVKLRHARHTEIDNSVIHGVPSSEWPDGTAMALWIEGSSDTFVHDNDDIGNSGMAEAVRILGSTSCELADSARTRIENSNLKLVELSGIGLRLIDAATTQGAAVDTLVRCSTISGSRYAVEADDVNGARFELVDFVSDTEGVRNHTTETLLAESCWWGHPSGPSGAGPGTGTSVTSGVEFTPHLSSSAQSDDDADGVSECQGDANDADPLIHPFDGCDGFDNDLDGTLDENFVSSATQCGAGVCLASGTTQCVGGVVQNSCTPGAPQSTDDASCDAIDQDCDGSNDQDYPAAPTQCGIGACARAGAIACVAGVVQDTCTPGAPLSTVDVTCDGVDDDCNGQSDEEFVAGPTQCGVGVCAATGVSSCTAGVFNDTCQPGTPTAATDASCDGLDQDCSGQSDEDFQSIVTVCGLGVCERQGATSCVAGSIQDSCVAGPPASPTDPICNGLDEDCDGADDDDYENQTVVCGLGSCARLGAILCQAGTQVEDCTPGSPAAESCNGLDDDCDGFADNNIPLPNAPTTLQLTMVSASTVEVRWVGSPLVSVYDVVRGSSLALQSNAGDYAIATERCLIDNLGADAWFDGDLPLAGESFWYLARGVNCAGTGSYDVGDAGVIASRDPGIAASTNGCP